MSDEEQHRNNLPSDLTVILLLGVAPPLFAVSASTIDMTPKVKLTYFMGEDGVECV